MITVNGTTISDDSVAREMQHHPSGEREEAQRNAATALVVRELLLQRAASLAIRGNDEEELLAKLVDAEIHIPEPTSEEVARFYRRNGLRFLTPALYEAAHIFFPARPEDDAAREAARQRAEGVLADLVGAPQRFAEFTKMHSRCSSKENGGRLGQVTAGDTNPELEHAFATMEPGSIAPAPVASRHGYHIVRLDHRAAARRLPLEQVTPWIEDYLRKTSRRRAIAQYLQLLVGQADIAGIDLSGADSPLVQ